ncbi:MAG: hypothetical protein JRJ45_07055 [Deltaproteobacteria bacterium]|nr:hypothetical protein [Deltaproteobacteria bacterium]
MQIDMHYYCIYAMARLAGLKPEAAKIIATASQYVDDAVAEDIQHHENGNMLAPILTAHRLIEILDNRNPEDQPFVWVPFHFFPGNQGKDFTERLLCRKDSALINEMINHYLKLHDTPFTLELIGIMSHVYADTFSHYGFSGVSSRRNKVDKNSIVLKNASSPTATYLDRKLDSFFRKFGFQGGLWTNIRRAIMSDGAEILSGALGHGAVATLPDIPYLEWSFNYEDLTLTDGLSVRNNTETFLEACEKLHTVFQRFASTSKGYDDGTSGVNFDSVKEKVVDLLSFQHGKSERSEKWRDTFSKGELGIRSGEEIPHYDPKTWDKQRDNFATLDKPRDAVKKNIYRFYQAASLHRHYMLRELLPKHNLVVI